MFVPEWLKQAWQNIGIHEGIGNADNPTVIEFFKEAGHPEVLHDVTPWCAAFVAAMLKRADANNNVSDANKLWAPSYAGLGVASSPPRFGCIGVKTRLGGGHVTFIVGDLGSHWLCLGGNQTDAVNIEAFPKSSFTAYRWPNNVPLPTAEPLPTSMTAVQNFIAGSGKPVTNDPAPAAVSTDFDTTAVQRILTKAGYRLIIDGKAGAETHAAIVDFQRRNELQPDGIIGPLTIAALHKIDTPPKAPETKIAAPIAKPAEPALKQSSVAVPAKK